MTRGLRIHALAALGALLVACTPTGPAAPEGFAHEDTAAAEDATTPDDSTRAFERVNHAMHADMAIEFTGDADTDFLRAMIPHHQGAIDMANVVLQHGKDPEIRRLAEQVIAAQQVEIATMERWLAERGTAAPPRHDEPGSHSGH